MTTRRLTTVAVLLAAVLPTGAGVVDAQETVRIAIRATASVSSGTDFVAVTGNSHGSRTFTTSCMQVAGFGDEHLVVTVVVVDSDVVSGVITHVVDAVLQFPITPGSRLTKLTLVNSCTEDSDTFNIYDATVVCPQSSEVALIITPAGVTLTADHEGVVGAATDEFDISNAVCVKQGSPTIKTAIISDTPLAAGDRLTGFIELDFDPETGETLYGCCVEY